MNTIDPKKVFFIFGGVQISGYGDGTCIEFDRDEDAYEKKTGADGLTARAKSNNMGGSFKITLMQTSPSNDALSLFMRADEADSNAVQPVLVKDMFGTSLITGTGWIKKAPTTVYSKSVEMRQWTIDCALTDAHIGGNS